MITIAGMNGNLYYWWRTADEQTWVQQTVEFADVVNRVYYIEPSIAWTGSAVVIAATGGSGGTGATSPPGDLFYWWQANATTTWHKQTVATGGSWRTPSIAWTGSSVVIAATGQVGTEGFGIYYWWQADGAATWNHEVVEIGDFMTPSIVWTGSSVLIAAIDSAGTVHYWCQDTNSWIHQTVETGNFSNPSIVWSGHSALIAANGGPNGPNGVVFWWQANGATTWHPEQVV